MNRLTKISLALAAAVFAVAMSSQSVRALTIVPPTLDYTVKPGDVKEGTVKIYNESVTDPVTVFSTVSNFTAKGETGEPDFDLAEVPTGAAAWVETAQGAITVQPNERIEVPFKITVPNNAEPGGHYVSLFYGTDPSLKPEDGGQVTVRSLLGALIIMRVEGLIRENASIATFTTKEGTSLAHLPATFDIRVQNSGNVHVRPQGTILIKNLMGGETETLSINDANGAVLPNSVRLFEATWKKGSTDSVPSGFFDQVKEQWANFAFGPYTATATMTYGQSKQTMVASTKVTLIPWQLLTVELLVLIVVILILVFGLKAYNKSIIRKAQQTPPPPKKG